MLSFSLEARSIIRSQEMNTGAQMRTRVQAQPWLLHRGDFAVCGQQHRSGCEKRVSGRDQQARLG
jgi:hypothetical protein